MSTLVNNIGELVTCDGTGEGGAGARSDMALVVVGDRIAWVGESSAAPATDSVIDVEGRCVTPGFVDSHAHLVFAGDRSAEFAARMAGQAYDGGGIGVSVEATRAADDDWLRTALAARIAEMRAQGTSTVEVKSGYGLTVEDEARALRLAAEVTDEVTYLGAHVVPAEMREDRSAYVDLVAGEMLAACAPHARWIDVFCEPASPHAFTGEESRAVLLAGQAAGLGLRVHGNQLDHGPGVQLACELGAASVDHCTHLSADDVDALVGAAATTSATLLPGVEFSTRSPYPDARALLDAGVSVALASDCNPGTCYSSSIPFVIALAVREMGMTPSEAVVAATRGGARALHRDDIGRIEVGARADLTVLEAPNHLHLSYRAGVPIARVLEV
ncbi:imidazolonepropionase [Janibacter limosus]|uniref:imidazolonepropionase n=1 Tax=Janibacter limosus TaxID=53458 RepID=UPI000831910C|nr:imidazolonepropionase [Janibacter limosus]